MRERSLFFGVIFSPPAAAAAAAAASQDAAASAGARLRERHRPAVCVFTST